MSAPTPTDDHDLFAWSNTDRDRRLGAVRVARTIVATVAPGSKATVPITVTAGGLIVAGRTETAAILVRAVGGFTDKVAGTISITTSGLLGAQSAAARVAAPAAVAVAAAPAAPPSECTGSYTAGNDRLYGGAGVDTLLGGPGADVLDGGADGGTCADAGVGDTATDCTGPAQPVVTSPAATTSPATPAQVAPAPAGAPSPAATSPPVATSVPEATPAPRAPGISASEAPALSATAEATPDPAPADPVAPAGPPG